MDSHYLIFMIFMKFKFSGLTRKWQKMDSGAGLQKFKNYRGRRPWGIIFCFSSAVVFQTESQLAIRFPENIIPGKWTKASTSSTSRGRAFTFKVFLIRCPWALNHWICRCTMKLFLYIYIMLNLVLWKVTIIFSKASKSLSTLITWTFMVLNSPWNLICLILGS